MKPPPASHPTTPATRADYLSRHVSSPRPPAPARPPRPATALHTPMPRST
ncbi:hypothetical protein ID866_13383 [Astraeus odoratus]|nr:hypothetical protein ID866_13383 [Astraeus odoratus]